MSPWLARLITETLQPPLVISVMLLVVGYSAGGQDGLIAALVMATFMCLLPWAVVIVLAKVGKLSDHHVADKKQRLPVLMATLVSAIVGILFALLMHAPGPVLAATGAVIAGLVLVAAVSPLWKISGHTTAVSGVASILLITFGPALYFLLAVPAIVGWSRLVLKAHNPTQVLAGATVGPLLIGTVYFFLTRS